MTLTERIGALSGVGEARETTYGTPVVPATATPFLSCTLAPDPGLFSPEVIMELRELQVYDMYGQYKFAGAVGGPVMPTNGIPYLVNAIGSDSVSGTAAPYTHDIQPTSYSSLTIEKILGGYQSEQYAGCRVNKYTLKSAATDTPLEFTADVIAQSAKVLDTPNPLTFVNESPFVFAEGSINWNGNQIGPVITSIQVDIENNLAQTWTHGGTHDLEFLTPTARHVSGTFDVVYYSLDDAVYGFYQEMFTGGTVSLQGIWQHPNGEGIAVNVNAAALSKLADDIKINDVIVQALSFEGFYGLEYAAPSVSAMVTNNRSTAF